MKGPDDTAATRVANPSVLCHAEQLLSTWTHYEWSAGIQIETIGALEALIVCTANSTYEITVLSPTTGEVLVRGGVFFPVYTRARLAGATLGGSFLKRLGIYVGFRMEIVVDRLPIITTPVQLIAVTTEQAAH